MIDNTNSTHPLKAIAIAEGCSTAVSLGALWAIGRNPGILKPLNHYLANTVIYPMLASNYPPDSQSSVKALQQKAEDKASILTKGAVMVGSGFVSHIPIQLALEGKFHPREMKSAAFGKGAGLVTALGSIMLLDRIAPSVMPALEKAIYPLIRPLLPKDDRGRESRQAEEMAKLLIIDVPSSITAGLINYYTTRCRR